MTSHSDLQMWSKACTLKSQSLLSRVSPLQILLSSHLLLRCLLRRARQKARLSPSLLPSSSSACASSAKLIPLNGVQGRKPYCIPCMPGLRLGVIRRSRTVRPGKTFARTSHSCGSICTSMSRSTDQVRDRERGGAAKALPPSNRSFWLVLESGRRTELSSKPRKSLRPRWFVVGRHRTIQSVGAAELHSFRALLQQ